MNTDRDYLAAGLALGGLSDAELSEAQALVDTDAEFRSEVAAYADTMALVAESDGPEPVSAATRDAILGIPSTHAQEDAAPEPHGQEQAQTPQAPLTPRQAQSESPAVNQADSHSQALEDVPPPADLAAHRRKRRTWISMAAAAAAVVVAAGVGVNSWQKQNELEDDLAATQQQLDETSKLMQADDLRSNTAELPDGGSVTVVSSESEQLIHVSSSGVEAEPGKSLQMWVIGDEGPESAGLMTEAATNIDDRRFTSGNLFGITVEPEGGSEQPTADPVVALDL
ncbi:anti-sigma factor domain-containing protein [Brevibacterium aurantiacum]|uniref:anti-sigma factor n=1 Tax=Brevibacterium aurantiacum TaxID=273384 RepID=UPI00005101EF|nr:anti-sigma factor [Brevibacterium aurantiacum]